MNRIYRLVWNRALCVLQVASELAHSPHGGVCTGKYLADTHRHPLALACARIFVVGLLGSASLFMPMALWAQTMGTAGAAGSAGTSGTSSGNGVGGAGGVNSQAGFISGGAGGNVNTTGQAGSSRSG